MEGEVKNENECQKATERGGRGVVHQEKPTHGIVGQLFRHQKLAVDAVEQSGVVVLLFCHVLMVFWVKAFCGCP